MKPERVRELLADYVRGRLGPADRAAVKAAVDADPVLAAECKELEHYFESLAGLPPLKAPPGFVHAVHARLEAGHKKKTLFEILFKPFSVKLTIEMTGLLATAILIIVIYYPVSHFVPKGMNPEKPAEVQNLAMAPTLQPKEPAGDLSAAPPSIAAPKAVKRTSALPANKPAPAMRRLQTDELAYASGEASKAGAAAAFAPASPVDELIAPAPAAGAAAPAARSKADVATTAKPARSESEESRQEYAEVMADKKVADVSMAAARARAKDRESESMQEEKSIAAPEEPVQLSLLLGIVKRYANEEVMSYQKKKAERAAPVMDFDRVVEETPTEKIQSMVKSLKGKILRITHNTPQQGQTSYSIEIPGAAYDTLASRLKELGTLSAPAEKIPAGQSIVRLNLVIKNMP
jgi:hypothetical protein